MSEEAKKSKPRTEKPVKEAGISAILTFIAALVSTLFGVVADLIATSLSLSQLFDEYKFLGEYLGFAIIVVVLIGVGYGLTKVAITYYQRKTLQTELATKKLQESEIEFYRKVDSDFSALLAGRAQ